MTDYTEYTRTASTAVAQSLRQAKDINLATIGVFQSLTSVLVPLSITGLPKADEIVPAIDSVVERGFGTLAKVVESQYDFGLAALDQLGAVAS